MAYKQRSPIIVGEGGTGATSLTDHGVVVGQDAAALTATAAGTDGQVIVAATLADPAFATLASLGGTVTFTLGANTLNLETGGAIASSFLTDDANSAVPALGVLTVSGGANIGTTSVASTVTIALNGLTDHAVHVGNAAGSLTALAIGATNEVLLGNTAADASWGTVGNAALTNSSVTLNNGNNITVTGSPLSLGGTASFDLTGCTQYAIQVGDATGSLDSLATGTATQIMQSGGAAAIPAWSTATYPATTAQGDVMFSSAANTVDSLTKDATATRYIANTGAANSPAWDQIELTNGVSGILPVPNGGTGVASPTDHVLIVGSGAVAMTELAVGATNEVLLGNTAADPSWGTVGNAALTNSSVTLSDGNNITVTGSPLSLGGTASFDLTGTTDHTIQLGNATGSLTSLGVATDGQIPIGSSAANPVLSTIASGVGIAVTNAAGSITISGTGGGLDWAVTTVNASLVVNNGYIANKAGLLTMTLPATAVVGDKLQITGINTAVGWRIAQNANQQIHFGASSTAAGVGGYVEATAIRDSAEMVCVVAGASTHWNIIASVGNFTIA